MQKPHSLSEHNKNRRLRSYLLVTGLQNVWWSTKNFMQLNTVTLVLTFAQLFTESAWERPVKAHPFSAPCESSASRFVSSCGSSALCLVSSSVTSALCFLSSSVTSALCLVSPYGPFASYSVSCGSQTSCYAPSCGYFGSCPIPPKHISYPVISRRITS